MKEKERGRSKKVVIVCTYNIYCLKKHFHTEKSRPSKKRRDGSIILVSDHGGLPPPPEDQQLGISGPFLGKDDMVNSVNKLGSVFALPKLEE